MSPRGGLRRKAGRYTLALLLCAIVASTIIVLGLFHQRGRSAGHYSSSTTSTFGVSTSAEAHNATGNPAGLGVFHGGNAIIVDPLATDYYNASLVRNLTNILVKAGFRVDYVGGANVTVEALKKIFSSGKYNLMIIRSHGGRIISGFPGIARTAIFTGEEYNERKYVGLRSAGLVGYGVPVLNPEKRYFVITSLFVETYGNFNHTIVIVAGCFSLDDERMAYSFIKKGALLYIGWKGKVEVLANDEALLELVKLLFINDKPVVVALREASSFSRYGVLDAVPRSLYEYKISELVRVTGK